MMADIDYSIIGWLVAAISTATALMLWRRLQQNVPDAKTAAALSRWEAIYEQNKKTIDEWESVHQSSKETIAMQERLLLEQQRAIEKLVNERQSFQLRNTELYEQLLSTKQHYEALIKQLNR